MRGLMITALAAVAAGTTATAQSAPGSKTIVAVAVEAGSFKTLVKAIEAAGLVETLNGAGPFTVFAPTDAAFAKLPAGTLESLLANPDKLRAILTYHVVSGQVMAAQVAGLESAATVNGQQVGIKMKQGQVWVGKARVPTADVPASNGVIHIIDTVLLPPN